MSNGFDSGYSIPILGDIKHALDGGGNAASQRHAAQVSGTDTALLSSGLLPGAINSAVPDSGRLEMRPEQNLVYDAVDQAHQAANTAQAAPNNGTSYLGSQANFLGSVADGQQTGANAQMAQGYQQAGNQAASLALSNQNGASPGLTTMGIQDARAQLAQQGAMAQAQLQAGQQLGAQNGAAAASTGLGQAMNRQLGSNIDNAASVAGAQNAALRTDSNQQLDAQNAQQHYYDTLGQINSNANAQANAGEAHDHQVLGSAASAAAQLSTGI